MCISCLFLKREKLKILRERVFEDNNNKIYIKKKPHIMEDKEDMSLKKYIY